jgi:hypothetical protein
MDDKHIKQSISDMIVEYLISTDGVYDRADFMNKYNCTSDGCDSALTRLKKDGKITIIQKGNRWRKSIYKFINNDTVNINSNNTVNIFNNASIRDIAEIAVQAIVTIVGIATESQNQKEELSRLNTETNDKLTKIMEVLYNGKKTKSFS